MTFDLITFGCSWTYGRGVAYENGMSKEKYQKDRDLPEHVNKYSFRAVLSEKWGCNNINYAAPGSSNMRQFRHALEHFISKPKNKTIVLWAITSIFRHEVWCNKKKIQGVAQGKGYSNICYQIVEGNKIQNLFKIAQLPKNKNPQNCKDGHVDIKEHLEYHFDIDNQMQVLCNQMNHWNLFFESLGIENYWMDTFNHHDYPCKIPRMLFNHEPKRDLLSMLVKNYINDTDYKQQDVSYMHRFDPLFSKTISEAKKNGLINPHSYHPTKKSHAKIADMIDEEIKLINNIR